MSAWMEYTFTVETRDVDMFGQCKPSALLNFLQEAATLASIDLGASGPEIREKYHCIWMVARMWAEMERPLRWNETFTIRTWHRGGSGVSTYRDFDIIADGKNIGQAVTTWVMADIESRKLFRMKDLVEFQGTDGGEKCKSIRLHRVKMPPEFDGRETQAMRYSHTDMNGHINNVHYADFACDALHFEELGKGKFVHAFQIGYVSECRAGETIRIDTAARGDLLYARGEGTDGGERFDFMMELRELET